MNTHARVRAFLRELDQDEFFSFRDVVAATGIASTKVSKILQLLADRGETARAGMASENGTHWRVYKIIAVASDTPAKKPKQPRHVNVTMIDAHERRMMKIMDGIDCALNYMTQRRLQGMCDGA